MLSYVYRDIMVVGLDLEVVCVVLSGMPSTLCFLVLGLTCVGCNYKYINKLNLDVLPSVYMCLMFPSLLI